MAGFFDSLMVTLGLRDETRDEYDARMREEMERRNAEWIRRNQEQSGSAVLLRGAPVQPGQERMTVQPADLSGGGARAQQQDELLRELERQNRR